MSEAPENIESDKEILYIIQIYAYKFSLYTYRTALAQFYLANKWAGYHQWLGFFSSMCTVIAGTSWIMKYGTLTGILALVASAFIAATTFFNPNKRSQDHYKAAIGFLHISEKARFLSEVESIMGIMTNNELKNDISELIRKKAELNEDSPRIPEYEWEKAGEDQHRFFDPECTLASPLSGAPKP